MRRKVARYPIAVDPTFAAQRLVIGDAVHEIGVLGDGMLRLDANGLLGIERDGSGRVWSEGHPLSNTSNQLIGDMVRKLGGFTFQELALALDDLRAMSSGGADLSYDFVTRPACSALTGMCIFIASTMAISVSASTRSPAFTRQLSRCPATGDVT